MKKEKTSYFGNLFGAKGKAPAPQGKSVILTSSSQPHVLRQRMLEEQMTHGETIAANISPVRLERNLYNDAVLYFCPMKKIEVLNVLSAGDGGSLPADATLEGICIPANLKSGLYKICNVEITSNGTMQVKATSNTKWERIESQTLF
jgi:hypothetical protein